MRIQKIIGCLIAGMCFYVSAASAQVGAITNIGVLPNNTDAIAFNSSGTLYGATSGGFAGALYTINPATGAATLIHAFVGVSNASLNYAIAGLAFQPGTGTLYGSTGGSTDPGLSSPDNLVTINPATGQVTVIGPTGAFPYTDLSFSGGTLVGSSTDTVASGNLATGLGAPLTTPVSNNHTRGDALAISSTGVIYVAANGPASVPLANESGALWTWTVPPSGGPTTLATLSGGPGGFGPAVSGMAFSPGGVLYGIVGGDGSSARTLVTISLAGGGGGGGGVPTTPIPPAWLLMGIGITCLALYQLRGRLAIFRQ